MRAGNAFIEVTPRFWAGVVGFTILGYLSMTRSFAYLGVRALNVFIGEVVLGLFLLTRTRDILGKWAGALTTKARLSQFSWSYYLFLGYGVAQLLRGIVAGYSPLTALQNLVFNVYPLYIFIGVWLGSLYPNYLGKFIRLLAWVNGVYGLLYLAVLDPLSGGASSAGDDQIALFGQPAGSALSILGLLCFETRLRRASLPLLLNAFMMLALMVRAEWLGFAIGFAIWGILSRKLGKMLIGAGAIIVLLGAGYLADFSMPAPSGRGGQISTRDVIGRGLSAIDPEVASGYSESAAITAGTVEWRKTWWEAIWNSVHETDTGTLFGHGYGFPIADLVTYLKNGNIRTPHNIFFFCLAHGGWIGVILFFAFQLTIFRLHWLTYKLTKQPFGMAYLAMCVSGACFGNFFETPFGAIPYYLITGLAIAPLQAKAEQAYVSSRFKNYSHQQAHVYGLELFHGATGRSAP
ncbi:MAG TPA: O-antigen ligase family protein [Blastocatellia bacterium]|nr:O-antigen ligase family protein [Blastocatellia bacterium]